MIKRDGGINIERVAAQQDSIRHWRIIEGDYTEAPPVEATWFIDSPYEGRGSRDRRPGQRGRVRYPHGGDALNYAELGGWARARQGQVIVCENEGATWLPFRPLAQVSAASPGKRSHEAVWIK